MIVGVAAEEEEGVTAVDYGRIFLATKQIRKDIAVLAPDDTIEIGFHDRKPLHPGDEGTGLR